MILFLSGGGNGAVTLPSSNPAHCPVGRRRVSGAEAERGAADIWAAAPHEAP